jgi:hypothetical protein
MKNLALYTTIYPGVEPFLKDWHCSVLGQTDQDFQLWVGLDGLNPRSVKDAIGEDLEATWTEGFKGDTPAQVRQRALEKIVEVCDGVVMVDSDDVLHDSRVAEARLNLDMSELAGCALRLVDQEGRDLGLILDLPPRVPPEKVLPRNNVFGLSNSAYRSDLLRRCLPIPAQVVLVDWFLATKAWLVGGSLAFDSVTRMDYRQHGANMVRVTSPFTAKQVLQDTERVRDHFRIVGALPKEGCIPERLAELESVAADVEDFYRRIVLEPARLERYVQVLNDLETEPLWWSWVAHPAFTEMWTKERK